MTCFEGEGLLTRLIDRYHLTVVGATSGDVCVLHLYACLLFQPVANSSIDWVRSHSRLEGEEGRHCDYPPP